MNSSRIFTSTIVLGALAWTLLPVQSARAYTPDSPEVQQMLNKALKCLEKQDHPEAGGKALIAMAMLKAGASPNHAKVQAGVTAVREYVATIPEKGVGHHCYNAAVACLFLIELDAQKYRQEIQVLLDGLAKRQLPNGCWAYEPYTGYDDTSQAQYGVLAYWAGHVNGFKIEPAKVVAAMNWFIRTQDIGGGWTYRAKDPKSMQKIQQAPPTLSMSAAGAGSIYICAYLFGYSRKNEQKPTNVPSALRVVQKKEEHPKYLSSEGTDANAFRETANRGNNWFATRTVFEMGEWTYYYMYALERYKAFQDLHEGKSEKEPKWYNDGVDFLLKTQTDDGGWVSTHYDAIKPVSTSFAVLFLTRSTQKSIKQLEGRLQGGQGLPADITQVTLNASGKVVDPEEKTTIDSLLKELEKDNVVELDLSVPERLELSSNPQEREAQLTRLRRMIMRGHWSVRRMAANTLARDRSLDNVPYLIYALADEDQIVKSRALTGLRFISRKIDESTLPEKPTTQELKELQKKWSDWYLSVRPGGSLIE